MPDKPVETPVKVVVVGKTTTHSPMWVTAYTDASLCSEAGWSVWCRSANGRIVRSGKCPAHISNSTAAEFYAAKMAVELVLTNWPNTIGIQINSDCLSVVQGLYPWSKPSQNKEIRSIQEAIVAYLKERNVRVRCKHVKGHTNRKDVRSWLNNRVDEMSRDRAKNRFRPKKG